MRSWGRGSSQGWDWERVSDLCQRLALRYASRTDADDVAQEALLRAWRFRGAVRDGERLEGWLAVIVRNEAVRQRARPRCEPIAEVDFGFGIEDERLAAITATADLSSALGKLDASERRLLELRYTQDLTQPAIAKALAMPEGTVKVRLHRARAKLRKALNST
jgi:RNA polymerase sigma-70 factor (ECF subfamily)